MEISGSVVPHPANFARGNPSGMDSAKSGRHRLSWFPPLQTSQGWGTRFCGELCKTDRHLLVTRSLGDDFVGTHHFVVFVFAVPYVAGDDSESYVKKAVAMAVHSASSESLQTGLAARLYQ